jgi:uncharacterized membrane protein YjjP (DUF1212 family)
MQESKAIADEKLLAGKHTELLLDIGSLLLASGAHSERINRNIHRIGEHWGYVIDIFFSFTGLILTIHKKDNPSVYATRHKRISAHGVNFTIVNEISLLSWKVREDNLSPEDVKEEFEALKELPHYSRWVIALGIGFACACLCLISKGDWKDAAFAFLASLAGILVRQQITKKRFNIMIAILASAFITTLIAGMDVLFHVGTSPEKALATSVLYLIPGVPLINSVIDLIEGYIPTAIARGIYGGFILLCIAVGMSLSILLIGLNNF